MENFTYEKEDRQSVLEKYEWDNVWIESTDNAKGKRVLYIGDSISCGTRRLATQVAEENILFDGFGTSKALDNPFFKDSLRLFTAQLPKTELIIFNNGLHGFHLDDIDGYPKYYEEMVKFLLKEYKNVPLFLLLTTYIRNEERQKRVKLRNKAVIDISEKYNLPVIDLYSVTEKITNFFCDDGVHFSQDGYEIIAKEIIKNIKRSGF